MSLTKVSFSMIEGEYVNVFDYMTAAEIADVQARTELVDVTAAVQAALDTRKVVYFPAGVYKITATLTGLNCCIVGEDTLNASTLKYTALDGNPLLSIRYDYVDKFTSISNITLRGIDRETGTGVYLWNAADIDDIDAYFKNVFFNGFEKSIHIVGRGLNVIDCIFVVTKYAVYLDRVAAPVELSQPDQKVGSGARVYRIESCRFHAMGSGSYCVANISPTNPNKEYTRGIEFVNNYIDTAAIFMIGGFRESLFSGNQHLFPSNQKIFDTDGGNIIRSNISSNTFSSFPTAGGATSRFYTNIVYCDGNVEGLTFSSNLVNNVNAEVIEITGNATNSAIVANAFNNVMINASTVLTRVVKVGGLTVNFNFTGNAVSRDELTATAGDVLVHVDGTASNTDCSHNAFNVSVLAACNKGGFFNFGASGNRVAYLPDVPTTGTWRQGDIVWDTNPVAGDAPGYVCVVGGTPGTWKAMANLAV
jgi:hypothetical protein